MGSMCYNGAPLSVVPLDGTHVAAAYCRRFHSWFLVLAALLCSLLWHMGMPRARDATVQPCMNVWNLSWCKDAQWKTVVCRRLSEESLSGLSTTICHSFRMILYRYIILKKQRFWNASLRASVKACLRYFLNFCLYSLYAYFSGSVACFICVNDSELDYNYISWLYFPFEGKQGIRGGKIMF